MNLSKHHKTCSRCSQYRKKSPYDQRKVEMEYIRPTCELYHKKNLAEETEKLEDVSTKRKIKYFRNFFRINNCKKLRKLSTSFIEKKIIKMTE